MLTAYLPLIISLASLSNLVSADVILDSFPDIVHVHSTYTLSWTATANYSYTIWLVLANTYESGEYDWTKVEGLATDIHYQTLSPSFTWDVTSNISTSGSYALWVDAFPMPFDGASLFNITDWFSVSSIPGSPTPATSSATPSATHTSGASDQTPSSGHHSGVSGGAIAGIVVGLLVALALVVGALLLARRRKKAAGIKDREAQARANRLAPVMQSPAAIEMHGRNSELAKETNV